MSGAERSADDGRARNSHFRPPSAGPRAASDRRPRLLRSADNSGTAAFSLRKYQLNFRERWKSAEAHLHHAIKSLLIDYQSNLAYFPGIEQPPCPAHPPTYPAHFCLPAREGTTGRKIREADYSVVTDSV